MNQARYEKVKRLSEESPFQGEREAAKEALKRMKSASSNPPEPCIDKARSKQDELWKMAANLWMFPDEMIDKKAFFDKVIISF